MRLSLRHRDWDKRKRSRSWAMIILVPLQRPKCVCNSSMHAAFQAGSLREFASNPVLCAMSENLHKEENIAGGLHEHFHHHALHDQEFQKKDERQAMGLGFYEAFDILLP